MDASEVEKHLDGLVRLHFLHKLLLIFSVFFFLFLSRSQFVSSQCLGQLLLIVLLLLLPLIKKSFKLEFCLLLLVSLGWNSISICLVELDVSKADQG